MKMKLRDEVDFLKENYDYGARKKYKPLVLKYFF